MKKQIYSFAILSLFVTGSVNAQNWKAPMADPNVSFYDIKADFYQDWGAKEQQLFQARQDQAMAQGKFGNMNQRGTPMPDMKGGYKQFKRWESYMEPRVYPSGDLTLPSHNFENFLAYMAQNQEARSQYYATYGGNPINLGNTTSQLNSPQPPSVMSNIWGLVGPSGPPTNGGAGRINRVVIDPTNNNTLYACAPAGGLWKSTNAGTTWSILASTDALNSIGCTDLAIDPTNTQIMYLATGDGDAGDTYSIGVMKSTDGGTTWAATGLAWTTNQGRTIGRLLINPSNTQIVMAFTSNGIYRTTTGGTGAWTQVQNTDPFRDAEYKPGDPNTVYATGTEFWKSTNGGAAWTQITSGLPTSANVDRLSVAVTAANTAYVYVLAGSAANNGFYGLYRSTDSGTTFTTRSTTPNVMGWASAGNDTGGQSWYDHGLGVSPTNQDVVVVGGVNVWRSTNGGTGWTLHAHWTGSGAPYVHADIHDITFQPGSSTTYYISNDGGVAKTTNTGTNWTDVSANMAIAQPYRIGLSASTANLWLTGHQDNGTNRYNGTYAEVMGGDGMDCFIDRTNNNNMYGEQYNGAFNRSTNGGTTWAGYTTGLTGTANWVTPWIQDPTNALYLWAGYTNVFRRNTSTGSWTQMGTITGTGTIIDVKVAPSNGAVIYAARSNQLWKSTNTGGTWTNITGTLPVGSAAITRIAIDPSDANNAWVTFSGYSAGNKVFVTTNGGTSWTSVSTGLPNLPVNCIVYTPGSTTDAIYVGCDIGVYYKDNSSATWQPYFTGLPNVPVFDLEIYSPTSKVRAATYGRSVWEVDIYNPGTLPPIAAFAASSTTVCSGSPVSFTDQSSFTPTSWSWTFPGATPGTSTAQNPTGIVWNTPGTYTVTLTATNANGSSNATQVVTVMGTVLPPLTQGFEAVTFPPTNWLSNDVNADGVFWSRTTAASGFGTSTACMKFDNYNNDVAGARDEILTPRMNYTGYTGLQMTFDVAYARYSATYSDTLEVLISNNCGTYTQLYIKGGTLLATAADQTATEFVPTAAQWRTETINLSAYNGSGSLQVIFRNRGRYGQSIYVDNVNITGSLTGPPPTASFTASATTVCAGTAVNFTDASTGSPTSWSWAFPSGTPATATTQNVTGVVWNTAGTYTVTLTATNANGSSNSTQVITVNARPTVTATAGSPTICSGNSTTLTGGGASTYTWNPGSLSGSPVTVTPGGTTTYTATGTAVNGCTNTQTVMVTVNTTPTVSTTASSTTICSGSSTTLTGSGASTYLWMPGSLTGTSVVVSPAITTTYTVTGTAANGCTATSTRTITVNTTPTVNATAGSVTICTGGSTTLTGSGASTYLWMPGSLSGTTVSVTPGSTTTYTVTGTAANGCTDTQTVTVTVTGTPTVVATAGSSTICSGSSTTLTGSGASTYSWMPGSLSGTTVTVSPTLTTTYTVTGTAPGGCTNTQTVTVTVNTTPTVTTSASSTTICSGSSTTLTGSGASTYAWMPGSLSGTSVVVSPATTTTYTVTGTAANGCTATSTRTITVNTSPTVTASAGSGTICTGASTTLTGSGASTYAWMPGSLSGTTVSITPATTTTYTVTGTAANGCTNTQTVNVTVTSTPTVVATASSPTICIGGSTTLTGSGASTYAWMPGSLSGTTVTVSPTSTTTYTVTGTAPGGCSNTQTVTVTVTGTPTVTATASSPTICTGGSTTLTGSGATTYTWMPGSLSGTAVTVSPTSTTTYTVTGTVPGGCTNTQTVTVTVTGSPTVTATAGSGSVCNGSSTTLTGSGATTYSWMPGSLSGTTVTVSPTSTTTYTVTGTAPGGCTNTQTVTVTVNSLPTVTTSASATTICAGNSVTITSSGASSYLWMPGSMTGSSVVVTPSSTTTYTVTGTAVNGCTNTATRTINVVALPNVTATASSSTICTGGSTTLTASGANTYLWNPGSMSGAVVTVSPTATTTYTVTGSNGTCINTFTITVTVTSTPTVTATASSPSICGSGSATLTAGGATTYVWMPGSLSGSSVIVSPSSTTTYTVTGTVPGGCSNTETITITVASPPTVGATASNATICDGDSTTLTASGASTYNWMPGSLSGTSVTVTPAFSTAYTVTGTDINGCTNTFTVTVNVNPLPTVSLTLPQTTICLADGPTLLTGESPSGGTFSGTGVSGGVFDPAAAGLGTHAITYSYTDGNNCSNTAMQNITVDICTGVIPVTDPGLGINVVPNPNNGTFQLNIHVGVTDDYRIEIINTLGQRVYLEELKGFSGNASRNLDVKQFGTGMYLVRLHSVDKELIVKMSVQ
ncbi:MAG: glycosyl hydrolase [Bacteroidetes bacterium]|nr:MAG: glycosyl hydrolase [Bacteroidota bacterium]